MLRNPYPILEFDPDKRAKINPTDNIEAIDMPEHCVVCFFKDVIDNLRDKGELRVLAELSSETGKDPVYEFQFKGQRVALFHPTLGAPSAVALLEEVIALGGRKFIACGGAGVLDGSIEVGRIIIPTTAVRDEGTSYHYLSPGREAAASIAGVKAIERVLNAHQIKYMLSKTWTTDAFYRSTPSKIELRRAEGCTTVEMECSAFFAAAEFREVLFAQLLYAGDDLCAEEWDSRNWTQQASVREKLFWLSAESCILL